MKRLILLMTASIALLAATGCENTPKKGSGKVVITQDGVYLDKFTVVPDGVDIKRQKLADVESVENPPDSDR